MEGKGILGVPRCSPTYIRENYNKVDNLILGLPYDGGTPSVPGQRHLPEIVRKFSGDFGFQLTNGDSLSGLWDPVSNVEVLEGSQIFDVGDLGTLPRDIRVTHENYLAATRQAAKFCSLVSRTPIFIGGDHSITAPLTDGVRDALNSGLDVLILDAHCDTSERGLEPKDYKSVTHANVLSYISEQDIEAQIKVIGVRTLLTQKHAPLLPNISCHPVSDEVEGLVQGKRPVYISIDLDALDPFVFPATGHPEPGGFQLIELINVISTIVNFRQVVAVDIVEGSYDEGFNERTGRLVGSLISKVIVLLNESAARN